MSKIAANDLDKVTADSFLWWLLFGNVGTLTDIKIMLISRGRDRGGNLHVSITVPYIYEKELKDMLESES